jgi:hypothetical protein
MIAHDATAKLGTKGHRVDRAARMTAEAKSTVEGAQV